MKTTDVVRSPGVARPLRVPRFVLAGCVFMTVAATAGGCATDRPFIWARDFRPAAEETQQVIRPRDAIIVHVQDQAALSGEFVVREDGAYLHPTIGNVEVAGKTPAQVAAQLQAQLTNLIVNARVAVSISRTASVRVNVVGEVKTPGIYELSRDRTVTAALAAAGWITDFAGKDRIFVVRAGATETRIRFHENELTAPEPRSTQLRLRDGDVVVVE
jgi:polysaccharide export outer membrane protein